MSILRDCKECRARTDCMASVLAKGPLYYWECEGLLHGWEYWPDDEAHVAPREKQPELTVVRAEPAKRIKVSAELAAFLASNQTFLADDVAKALRCDASTARKHLRSLSANGEVRRVLLPPSHAGGRRYRYEVTIERA